MADIANKYGESAKDAAGKYIPFKGELHSVTVQLVQVAVTVDADELGVIGVLLCAALYFAVFTRTTM